MPGDRSKRPMPAVIDVAMVQQWFGTEQACWEHLRSTRWEPTLERFTCPECRHSSGWWLANDQMFVPCSLGDCVTDHIFARGARVETGVAFGEWGVTLAAGSQAVSPGEAT